MIPNGDKFTEEWLAVGHVGPEPELFPKDARGFPRNPFGLDFAKHGFKWTAELCERDSDGDGLTNGQELGDPHCTWHVGMPSPSGDVRGHPGLPHATLGGLRAYWAKQVLRYSNETATYAMNYGPIAPPIFVLHYAVTPLLFLVAIMLRFFKVRGAHYPRVLALVAITYLVGHVGVFCGNHRCYSHSACKPTLPGHWIFAVLSVYAMQGPATHWALYHRTHHRFCEQAPLDVHSPISGGRDHSGADHGGFLWAQGTFFWYDSPHIGYKMNYMNVIPDLELDPELPLINKSTVAHVFCWFYFLLAFSAAACAAAAWRRKGRISALFAKGRCRQAGSCVREALQLAREIFVCGLCSVAYYFLFPSCASMQITSFVNSAVHIWGDMPYDDAMSAPCRTYNNAFLFWPMLGENWHNNHHGNPRSHSTAVRWYQLDCQGFVIRMLERVGLVTDVHTVMPTTLREGYSLLPFYSVLLSWAQMAVVMALLTISTRWLLCDDPFPWSSERLRRQDVQVIAPVAGSNGKKPAARTAAEEMIPLNEVNADVVA